MRALACWGVLSLLPLSGCGADTCWGLELDQTYSLTVREFRPGEQRAIPSPCGPTLFPAVGDTVQIRVVDARMQAGPDRECSIANGVLQGEHSLNLADGRTALAFPVYPAVPSTVVTALAFVDWNGCRGTWSVIATGRSKERDPFVRYRPGDPEVVLYRAFFSETEGEAPEACRYCQDHFGVEVSK